MKKAELTFASISVPVDYLMLILAGLTAYKIRYSVWIQEIRPVIFDLDYQQYLHIVLAVAFVWLFVFAMQGLYTISFHKKVIDELLQIVFACSTGLMLIIVYIFWQREFFDSRFIILAAWTLAIAYVGIARLFLRYIRRLFLIKNWGVTKLLLIGEGKISDNLAAVFYRQPALGYKIVERLDSFNEERLDNILAQVSIDEIILSDPQTDKEIRSSILSYCDGNHLGFRYIADIFDAQSHNVDIRSIGGMPIIEIKKTPLDGWGRIYKRIFDIIFSLILFILFSPFAVLIIMIIKMDSAGPILVSLKRVGKSGEPFYLYKFRSMIKGAHLLKYDAQGNLREEFARINERTDGPLFKNENDTRITRFGKFLRHTSLDEIPQLINVLKGEMSLVGPRPHEPEEVKLYEQHQRKLLSIKPGMTGLAQISGRARLNFVEEVKLDLYYIENWSLRDDIQIMFKTGWVVIKKQGA